MASDDTESLRLEAKPSHLERVFQGMLQQYQNGLLLDFTIRTRAGDISCHRLVVASTFKFFGAFFETNTLLGKIECNSIDLYELNSNALKELIEFAYKGEISIREDTAQHLVEAARYLQADAVTDQCDEFLVDIVNENNCMKWYVVGSTYSLPLIQKKTHDLVLRNFPKLISSEDFPKLHWKCLMEFLSDDALNVPSEETVIDAILAWITHDKESRHMAANRLVDAVRLNHCSHSLLCALKDDPKYDIISNLRFRNLIRNVLRERFGPVKRNNRRSSIAKLLSQGPRFSFTSNKLLVVGGRAAENDAKVGNTRDCMYWDRSAQTWVKFTELPSHYSSCRQWNICATDGRIFVSGGQHKHEETGCWEGCSEVWMWYQNRWHALPSMMHGRWAHGMVFASNKLFCFGGKSRKLGSHVTHLKQNECLNLELLDQEQGMDSSATTCQWTATTKMKFNFYSPLLSVLGENIYILGMMGCPSSFVETVYEYNIPRRTLTVKSSMPSQAQSGVSFAVGENIFVFGVSHRSTCMRYTPSTDTWCRLEPCVNFTDDAPDSSIYLDHISPLVFFDGKIILAKLMRREKRGNWQFVDSYDIERNTWSKSDLMLPACYSNKEVSLFNVEMDV